MSDPRVLIQTSMGDITVELNQAKAPISVANFLSYVDDKFYDGTIFHRVIPDFMIQGGGFEPGMKQKKVKAPIKNESGNGLAKYCVFGKIVSGLDVVEKIRAVKTGKTGSHGDVPTENVMITSISRVD
jgi:cyclophilin family peptidyl-prolyl cis-trans isomerase